MSGELDNKFVSKSISELFLKSEFADVQFAIVTDDEIVNVPANKAILAAASPVFQAMFFGPMKEDDIVQITDTNDSAFKEFLQFFYLPKVKLTMKNIEAVVQLVDKYDMVDCLNACVEFLENELTMEKMIWGLQLAISMNNQKLREFCQNKIQSLTSDCLKSDIFLHCDRDVVKNILQLDAISCSEAELFEACIAWAKMSCEANGLDENDSENLRNQLGDCFYLIRFGAMKDDEIAVIMSNQIYNKLFSRDELVDILCSKSSEENSDSKVFSNTPRSLVWDSSNVLTCDRGTYFGSFYSIQDQESTWFSTTEPVLLGEISCPGFCDSQDNFFNVNFNMNIIEYQGQTFEPTAVNKVLFTATVECGGGRFVSLPRPILINPRKMYEVRFETIERSTVHHLWNWKAKVKLDDTLVVRFHRNPSGNSRSGLVKDLKFCKIPK